MNNPLRILKILDSQLNQTVDLNVYGRAALALGFVSSEKIAVTLDVDLILPKVELSAMDANEDFWKAIEQTNQLLSSEGLYLTHIFLDDQVILSPGWMKKRILIKQYNFKYIQLFRPSTADLFLRKMMRIDPQDREDMLFLAAILHWKSNEYVSLFDHALLPNIIEIEEAFVVNKEWFLEKRFS